MVGLLLLPQAMTIFLCMALTSWRRISADVLADRLFLALGMGLLLAVSTLSAVRWRTWWGVCWFFFLGATLIVAYPLALAAAFAVPLGLVRPGFPAARLVGALGAGGLLCLSPLTLSLYRALRLAYWQPWTGPERWEAGDEQAPGWAKAIAGPFDHK